MKKLITNIIFAICVLDVTAQVDSAIVAYPVNDSIHRAFAINDDLGKVPFNFSTDSLNHLNDYGNQWFYMNVSIQSPEIEFLDSLGIDTLEMYGPFDTDFNGAASSVEFGNVPPSFSQRSTTNNLRILITLPEQDQGLYIFRLRSHMQRSVTYINPLSALEGVTSNSSVENKPILCAECIDFERPSNGKYVISAWYQNEAQADAHTPFYTGGQIVIIVTEADNSTITTIIDQHKTGVIDGWQQIEGEFELDDSYVSFRIELRSTSGNIYFDDVRMFPYDASMKSYVYDPINLRLMAELDERNFATLYEYDEEGRLKRVKKETERGVMTIQETTTSITKYSNE